MKRLWVALAFPLLFAGAACTKPNVNIAAKSTNTAASVFPRGMYYRVPNLVDPSAVLTHQTELFVQDITMSPVDFDVQAQQAIYPNDSRLVIVAPDGTERSVTATGIYQIARPSLSPDGTRVAVQATATKHPDGQAANPSELKIFVVDLRTGSTQQVSSSGLVPNESPTWFNQSDRILYSTFSAAEGVDVHVYDLDLGKIVLTVQDIGWHGIAVSKDDQLFFVPNSMRTYSVSTGALVSDLKAKVTAGILALGFTLQTSVGDSGSPFLDGDWSLDGKQLVFDVAVIQDGRRGVVIFTVATDGTNVLSVSELIPVNPVFSNNLNYSQLNPIWL